MNVNEIIRNAFKKEVGVYVKAYGIKRTVKELGNTGPFAYFPKDVDLEEFLEELFEE
jgi:hypothetical protein